MSYGQRVGVALVLFFTCGAFGIGALLAASHVVSEADMHVGKGSVKFPPQIPRP